MTIASALDGVDPTSAYHAPGAIFQRAVFMSQGISNPMLRAVPNDSYLADPSIAELGVKRDGQLSLERQATRLCVISKRSFI